MVFVLSICQSRNETGQGFFIIFITRTLMFWKDIFLGSLCLLVKIKRKKDLFKSLYLTKLKGQD